MYNFRRRKSKTARSSTSSSTSTSSNSSNNSNNSSNINTMCRSSPTPDKQQQQAKHSSSHRRTSKRSRSSPFFGILKRPSWGGLVGLGGFKHHIQDPELRKSVLPRRPACMNLPNGQELPTGSDHSSKSTKNDPWELDSNGGLKQTPKKLKLLEELQKEPLKTKQEMTESQKWKALDDLVDMAYKIRVSDDYYDWDKLLEEDVEEEEDEEDNNNNNGNESELETKASACKKQQQQQQQQQQQYQKQQRDLLQIAKPQRRKAYEKPSIHLHRVRAQPAMGPGVLLA